MNRLRALVLLTLLTSFLLTWQTTPASAAGGILQWNENGDSYTTFGPNVPLTIFTGAFSSCPTMQSVYPWADIYVIPHGSVPAVGGNLKSVAVGKAPSATVQGTSGGGFVDETIGYTAPGGKIGAGTYDVVYNVCQDGTLGPQDDVFSPAFTVNIPTGVPLLPSPQIQAIKASAHRQYLHWLATWAEFKALFMLLKAASKTTSSTNAFKFLTGFFFTAKYSVLDPQKLALNELWNNYKHYEELYNDPPDPNYQQLTPLGQRLVVDPQGTDPLMVAATSVETAGSSEENLNGALLASIERYEGAQAANDWTWASIHAAAVKRYAQELASQLSTTNASLSQMSNALGADGRPLDSDWSTIANWRQAVVTNGFSTDQVTELHTFGLTDAQIQQYQSDLAGDTSAFARSEVSTDVAALQSDNNSQIVALNDLASAMDPIISQTTSMNTADLPVANAGSGYTVAQGATLTVDAGQSTSKSAVTSYAWDLTGSGSFTDATGRTATVTYSRPFTGWIGLKVTSAAGYSDIAYTPVTVTSANDPPRITGSLPSTGTVSMLVGGSQQFSVTTTDAENDTPAMQWLVDGAPQSNGSRFTYSPSSSDVGMHMVQVLVTDANNPQGFASTQSWFVTVEIVPQSLTLSSPLSSQAVGKSVSVSATLADAFGFPLDGYSVALTITGPNPATLRATTGVDGVAAFTDTGSSAGDDTLTASVNYLDAAGVAQSLSSAPASIHWFTPSVPDAPTGLQIQRESGGAYMYWKPPTSDGGVPIDGYDVTISGGTSQTQHLPGGARNTSVSNLTGGTQYTVSVMAHNTLGFGPAATATFTAGYLPGEVTGLQMTAGNGSLTVTWSPPTSDGGLPIDHYTAEVWDCCRGKTLQVTGTTARFIGLRPGDTYHVAVTAHNAIGDGPGPGTPPTITLPRISLAYAKGDVFVGVDGALVYHLDSEGNFLGTLDTQSSIDATGTGMCFDSAGNLYATTFFNNVSKFDSQGNLVAGNWAHSPVYPESCTADARGNVYVGDAGVNTVTKFGPGGNVLATYTVAIDDKGTDWVDLGADQCTLYYSSEGDSVKRFNVCTNAQLPDLASRLAAPCYALRVRPNGEVMIACHRTVYRLDPQGNILQTYSGLPNTNTLFALNLDPDGTSFWTADYYTRAVYKLDIASGRILTQFTAPQSDNGIGVVGGLAVYGELRAALMANTAPVLTVPDDQAVPYNDPLSFSVSAADSDGDRVSLSAGGLPTGLSFTDHGNGTGAVSGTVQAPPGSYDVTVTADDGQSANNTDVKHLTITVTKEDTTLTYTGDSVTTRGGSVHLSAVLKEDGTTPMAGQMVSLALGDQSCTGTTDVSGTARCTIFPVTVGGGGQTAGASFSGDHSYVSSSDSAQVLVRVKTTLAFTAASTTTADYHDPASLGVVLVDNAGNPIPGASLSFDLGTQTCSGTSDSSGAAACTITPNGAAGSVPLTASFGGMSYYLPSTASGTFAVTKEETQLRYTGPTLLAQGSTALLSTLLQEDGTVPIAGQTVTLNLGSQSCTGVTDGSGKVSCSLTAVTAPLGPQTVTAAFAGDASDQSSTASQPALVYAWPSSGSFVIGSGSAGSNSSVTYWGAQWSQANALAGGTAPAAFKGFADTPSSQPPACGGTWTSTPGNSSKPPAGVPSYMAVIVSSSVTQSGSTVSGDIAKIVIVKTDPGYGPNPGTAGTGSVVAQLCP